jgi:hypothetical protein
MPELGGGWYVQSVDIAVTSMWKSIPNTFHWHKGLITICNQPKHNRARECS